MKKRGISAVVATILIILIVVVGVGIVWKVILPIFQELEFLSYSDVQLNIVRQGFTVYDPEQNFAFVQIERGGDEVNVTGVEIGFNFNGTTKTYQSPNVPTPNGKYTYKFNFTNDSDMGIPQNVTPDKVTVAPIFIINNKVRLGKILDSEDMPVGRIRLSAEEWEKANNESAIPFVVKHDGNGEEPGEKVEPDDSGGDKDWIEVGSCQILDQEGKYYQLNESISATETCIIINADNIVLDLNGYTITGNVFRETIYGVYVSGFDNVTIRNGEIQRFTIGIYLESSTESNLEEITTNINLGGVKIESGYGNTFIAITAVANRDYGVLISQSSKNILTDIIVNSSNLGEGISILQSSENKLINIVADLNTQSGIRLESSSHNVLINVEANGNTFRGISIEDGLNNTLNRITTNDNSNWGITFTNSTNNTLTDVESTFNYGGISVYYFSHYSNLTNVVANNNRKYGVRVSWSSHNILKNITAGGNPWYGIDFQSSSNFLTDSNFCGNQIKCHSPQQTFTNNNCSVVNGDCGGTCLPCS